MHTCANITTNTYTQTHRHTHTHARTHTHDEHVLLDNLVHNANDEELLSAGDENCESGNSRISSNVFGSDGEAQQKAKR